MALHQLCHPVDLEAALKKPNGSLVDIVAVVGHVGFADGTPYWPLDVREVALVDESAVAFLRLPLPLRALSDSVLLDSGLNNSFLVATNLLVDTYSRCLVETGRTSFTVLKPGGCSALAPLEDVRKGIREIPVKHDWIRQCVIQRDTDIKRLGHLGGDMEDNDNIVELLPKRQRRCHPAEE